MDKHPIRCRCGQLQGEVDVSERYLRNHVICYCKDCQKFAEFLGDDDILDQYGGTEIVQIAPSRVQINLGMSHLSAVRLTQKGTVRWYASCCQTPIGNTVATSKVPFVGLIHNCINGHDINETFGPLQAYFNAQSAKEGCPHKNKGVFLAIVRFILMAGGQLVNGRYKTSPFFDQAGELVVKPKILHNQS